MHASGGFCWFQIVLAGFGSFHFLPLRADLFKSAFFFLFFLFFFSKNQPVGSLSVV